jgi:biofilm PGA synthesis lipoprotein PgaB
MRCLAAFAAIALTLFSGLTPAADWPDNSFAVLCYHEIRDDARQRPDAYTLETGKLALQFEWLRSAGYQVVSLDQVIAARSGGAPLPPRAVLITFDDGLESVYTRALPLLEAFRYPAVVALVGSWLEDAGGVPARGDFLRGAEIEALRRSGLIEFASHTFRLHDGIIANPQGNLEPAAAARRYDPASGGYEDAADHAARIAADLAQNSERIAALAGVRPRLIVWPYGAHDRVTDALAAGFGMPYGMSLELGLNTPDVPLTRMRRIAITQDYTTADLARVLDAPGRRAPLRALALSLDEVHDADPAREEAKLSQLLDRVQALGVNAVFLQAGSAADGSGRPAALYFPNRHLPVRSDLFNRAAWQLRTRTGVEVFASLPADIGGSPAVTADIYDDLSAAASFQGLVLADDPGAVTLAARVAADHDGLLTARRSDGGGLPAALRDVDFVLVPVSGGDLRAAVAAAARSPQGLARTVFVVPGGASAARMLGGLRGAGARNLAAAADDGGAQGAAPGALRRALSLQSFPGDN